MNKKGFTLIELLAIIIIVAILALIIVPTTRNLISSSRKKALKNSAQGLVDAAENYYAIHGGEIAYTVFEFDEKGNQISKEKLSFKGAISGSGIVAINVQGDIAVCVSSGKYYAYKVASSDEIKVVKANGDAVCELPEKAGDDFTIKIDGLIVETSKDIKHRCESNLIDEKDKYKDKELNGADPELYEGMIPVNISDKGIVTIADVRQEWYSYKDHKWANAVVVNYKNGQIANKYFNGDMTIKSDMIGREIQNNDILQYYVWIPRYKYKLWNTNLGVDISTVSSIDVVFENAESKKSEGSANGEYLTHPAFTFGETELNGFWVGKFETTSLPTAANIRVTIRPNYASQRSLTLSAAHNYVRDMDLKYAREYGFNSSEIDSHLMKNMEWGAMAYLTNSRYGRYDYMVDDDGNLIDSTTCTSSGSCEVWINCNNGYLTGCACGTVSAGGSTVCNKWDTALGKNASTTGNISGIYDTVGGAYEFVMGSIYNASGLFYAHKSGFTAAPEDKYIDMYDYSTTTYDWQRSKLGDAMGEPVNKLNNANGHWNSDYSYMPYSSYYYIVRGGYHSYGASSGIFSSQYATGEPSGAGTYRIVITKEDN